MVARSLFACGLVLASVASGFAEDAPHSKITQQRASRPLREGEKITFERTTLDNKFRSEGVAYGDFNGDGKLDIAAGSVWYAAPDWKMQLVREKASEFDIRTYGDTFCNWAEDLNGDGRQDLIVVDFPGKPTWWFQNSGPEGGPWKRHEIVPVTNDESPNYLDLDGDGRRELLYGDAMGRMSIARPAGAPAEPWLAKSIAQTGEPNIQAFYHGLGVGDLSGDGRLDVIVPHGWWEAPAKASEEPWTLHKAPFGDPQANLYVFDFDGDGDPDMSGSSAHRRGLWWYENRGESWERHVVDDSIAQTHAMWLADIDGDGLPDFVTGKRYYAHNGRDPGEDEPALLAWYGLSRKDGKPIWTKNVIDSDSGVGTQFEVIDMNGDELLDVIVANKRGVFHFQQKRE